MSCPPLEALSQRHGLATVQEHSVDRFLTETEGAGRHAVLFFPGHAKPRPEANDVAVILPQILEAFVSRLSGAVVDAGAEEALAPRFGALVFPSLVILQGDHTLGAIARVKDWSFYVSEIGAMLAPQPEPVP